MSMASLISTLLQKGVQLIGQEDKLEFRAPKGALTASDKDQLRANKSAILDFLRGGRAARLSGMQERLWFLDRLDTSGVGYVIAFAFRIRGSLEPRDLSRAFNEVIRLHPGLRATFIEMEGTPVQLIVPSLSQEIPVHDARGESMAEVEQRLRTVLVKPFDHQRGPLFRSVLIRVADDDQIWGIAMHHLIGDGQTFGIIVDDLSTLLSGRAPEMPGRLDYADYLEWERVRANSPEVSENLAYWLDKLAHLPDVAVPLDHPRPVVRTHEGARTTLPLPSALSDRIHAFARTNNVTLFAVLLSIYAVYLGHATGHDDIVVGSPHANRPDSAFERTAGCFVSTLVLRMDLSGNPHFHEVVRRVSDLCTEAWDRREHPYEKLSNRLGVTRDTSKNALFQTFFALQNTLADLRIPGRTAELFQFDTGNIQFDLELHFFLDAAKVLSGVLLYNRNLFEQASMQKMAERWVRLAHTLLDVPAKPVFLHSLLSEAERRALAAWNCTDAAYPMEKRFDELFVAQAERAPERAAVVFRGRTFSYADLSAASDAIGVAIVSAADCGARIGIFLDRSFEMVAAVLAVARAGAIFVPMDPELPRERLAYMASDSGVRHVLTRSDLLDKLPPGVEPIWVDSNPATVPRTTSVRAAHENDDRPRMAYILYTSGSTGRPKGVLVGHRALTNLLTAMAKAPGIEANDVLVAVTSLSFDISLLEILLPLLHGATVVMAARDEVVDPQKLSQLLVTHRATRMQATPSMWRILLDVAPPNLPDLVALCGGELLNRDLADRLLKSFREVWNLYGPTETTIWSGRFRVGPGGPISIGRPIENTRFYVLTPQNEIAPPGICGELCIAGDGLAEGYVNRPEETTRRFVDLVDIVGKSERVYKTGDLVRWNDDGALICLGRTDQQVKVRGHRVELEEIEHILRGHTGVRDAVITLAPDGGGLVAHVLAAAPDVFSERSLRDFAVANLPSYMVPQRIVVHQAFPVSHSGKTDRQALAAMPLGALHETSAYEAPQGEIETFVAELFVRVLGIDRVGRWDDFFHIGGHSLIAARVLHGMKEQYGVEIQIHELFQKSTVAALAARIQSARDAKDLEDRALEEALQRLESMSDEEAALLLSELSVEEQ